MEHGGEAARPTTVGSTELGMAGAVRGIEAAIIGSGAFDDTQFGAAAARRFSFDAFQPGAAAYHNNSAEFASHVRAAAGRGEVPPVAAGFHFHRQPGPGVAYPNPNFSEFWRLPGLVRVVLVGAQLPDGVVLLSGGGAVYNGDYALQRRPDAGHGEVFMGLLPGGDVAAYPNNDEFWPQLGPVHVVLAGAQLPDAVVPVHDNSYGHSSLQPRPGAAGRDVVLAGLLTGGGSAVYNEDYALVQPRRGAGHSEVFVDLLPDGAGHGKVFLGQLPDGVGAVFDNSVNFAQQTPPGTGRADRIAGPVRGRNFGAGHDGSRALAGAAYNNLGTVAEHLRRLLPFAGVGACSVAVNGLAAGPGSLAVAFDLFAMFLGGLLLVILHVLRV